MRSKERRSPLFDCVADAVMGAITGFFYGVLAWLALRYFTEASHPRVIPTFMVVFAFLGIYFERQVFGALSVVMHFLWGLVCGVTKTLDSDVYAETRGYIRGLIITGMGIGLALALFWF